MPLIAFVPPYRRLELDELTPINATIGRAKRGIQGDDFDALSRFFFNDLLLAVAKIDNDSDIKKKVFQRHVLIWGAKQR